jgi:hypothetical protein
MLASSAAAIFLETEQPVRHLIFVKGKRAYHPQDVEQAAEAYCLGIMTLPEAAAFEDHYMACAQCAAIVECEDLYVGAMREAARRLRWFDRNAAKAAATDC